MNTNTISRFYSIIFDAFFLPYIYALFRSVSIYSAVEYMHIYEASFKRCCPTSELPMLLCFYVRLIFGPVYVYEFCALNQFTISSSVVNAVL